ncbi:predicted protein [Aspergillus nidulans FGSC A4]|uniref:Uncharacterized protein n=1 Tax=Emericella nidulans (strain FGSC A4 / ATCC 38163 / CBS 112.46 / NRRL 194 / M139) TaxID=227321 RepID=Q5AR92_EMENI|nr:hypothetical protein [Aspergillus nidulans FGSC A4]EAA61479.1 predicted protein [Aspergillus nidulans FGSC A4]CBF82360.1 TPA: conserved hypothetical protein [Aspergillus nidulans FGSC A4]|eukprot:XP_682457.1 predicted protein [Aspergillus nidulans FGSC A4]
MEIMDVTINTPIYVLLQAVSTGVIHRNDLHNAYKRTGPSRIEMQNKTVTLLGSEVTPTATVSTVKTPGKLLTGNDFDAITKSNMTQSDCRQQLKRPVNVDEPMGSSPCGGEPSRLSRKPPAASGGGMFTLPTAQVLRTSSLGLMGWTCLHADQYPGLAEYLLHGLQLPVLSCFPSGTSSQYYLIHVPKREQTK